MASRSRKNKAAEGAAETAPKVRKQVNVSSVFSGVAVPPSGRGAGTAYPFAQLTEDGQMFFVQGNTLSSMRGTCHQRNRKLRHNGAGFKFVARAFVARDIHGVEDGTEGVGVWRVNVPTGG